MKQTLFAAIAAGTIISACGRGSSTSPTPTPTTPSPPASTTTFQASSLNAGGGASFEPPMIDTFRSNTADPPDRIRDDGKGSYIHKIDQVRAVLDMQGDVNLRTNNSPKPDIRTLFLDFGAPASADATPPFSSAYTKAIVVTVDGHLPNIAVGSSIRSKFQVLFSIGKTGYFIRFGSAKYPDTSDVLITRTASDTWEIEAGPTDVAKLLTGDAADIPLGNFFMPFKFVTKKKA